MSTDGRSPLKTRMFAVHTPDSGDRAGRRDAAREGRAAAMLRRRQLSQGKQALSGGATAPAGGGHAPALIVYRGGAA